MVIEIESLAVTWAVEKFHHFLYGYHFTLETDQKPLEAILSRSLNQAMLRLQCILIRMLPYNFTVKYIPGPRNLLAGLPIQIRGPERYHQITEVTCISDLATTTSKKWTDCTNFDKLLKLMNLLCLNISLQQDGPIPSRKCQWFYTHIGCFVRDSP